METEYELKKLEQIISKDIASFIEMRRDLFSVFRQAIKEETNRIKDNFSQASFKLDKKSQLKKYIRFHQQAIVRLEGYLLHYAEPEKITRASEELDKATLCRYLYFCLEELLSFVGRHFPEYFDREMWIPDSYQVILEHQLKQNINMLEDGLSALGIDKELCAFALHPINEFLLNTSHNEVTYRKVIYIKEVEQSIMNLIQSSPEDPKVSLQWLLIENNFNSLRYFQYCTQQIDSYINETDVEIERLDRLAFVQKLIYQAPVKPGFGYEPNLKSLQTQLSDWLAQEIGYLESRGLRLAEPTNVDQPATGMKIQTDLSVPQLAYLLRVFIETKVFQINIVAVILRFIPAIFQSKRSSKIGLPSLSNQYYKPESSTKKAVRDLLIRLAKHIEKSETLI